ncbi:MAG TPA: bifunctional diaminohydroxyphosphoribosylaminopyrimidine deaminase/5-amino-6-(5-phosphoribosylamino)uracil reductase RibD [Vicinamibacterales bacterium]|nr:bifunctional diaminohydroxyphosphoribosylaminopyrimidine deaminase/5-amino-6-(5-phosphoribosylamino)uracil reductase RibD [Vicinamibacterales bacterium]
MTDDAVFMDRALFLAERGRGRTSPNPIVGAVVVSPDGIVVGQGAHLAAGRPHAEIVALDVAGPRARGATLYCTLEPCAHAGRTGPCVERIAAAGIARVVAAVQDPNPKVAGRGTEFLRAHGAEVVLDVERDRARALNAFFFTWIGRHRPFVILKTAVSADGFVGRAASRVKLTGPAADRYFHRQRAEVDAIAVGSGTVVADDPLLTPRGVYRERPLTRVLFDRRARIPAKSGVFSTLSAGPVIMIVSEAAARTQAAHLASLERQGVTIDLSGDAPLRSVLGTLAERQILSLLVEGGPTLQQAFLEAHLVDRLQWITTPTTLGTGVPAVCRAGLDAGEPRRIKLGDDVLMEFDVHGTD